MIAQALEDADLEIDVDHGKQGIGGLLVAPDRTTEFDTRVRELDEPRPPRRHEERAAIRSPIRRRASRCPSGFDIRRDPLLGTPAMHAGIDFRGAIWLAGPRHRQGAR